MENQIRILSTKKLSESQKQPLLNANFLLIEENFITVQNKDFTVENINEYLIFTSKNAIESVLNNKKIAEIKAKKCFCVGSKTKAFLEQNGFQIEAHSDYAAELASIICNNYLKNSFTFFSGNLRRDILPDAMTLVEINWEEVQVYDTLLTTHKIGFEPDGVLFFSPSGVESYMQENRIEDENCFCIGNTTAEALKYATPNIIIANQPTVESTIMKCIEYYKN
jgi:uroporphyrinogen-III synthase